MQKSMIKMLLMMMLLKEMILLLMQKFLLALKNHPYHLLLHHHNHLKISHQHPKYNTLHNNHLRRVEHFEYDKVAQALEITRLKRRVKKLEKGNRVRVLKLRRLKIVGTSQRVDTSKDIVMDDASNQGRIIDELDKDDVVALMDDKEGDKKEEEVKVVEDDQVQGSQAKFQAEIYKIDLNHASKVLSMQEDEPAKVQEVVDVVTTTKRRKGVVIRDPEEESTTFSIIPAETKSKDKGKGILVEEPKPLKKKQHVKMDEEYTRKLHAELNKDIEWDVAIDHVKQKAKEDPAVQRYQVIKKKPQTEAQARKNIIMYLKNVADKRADGRGREQSTTDINKTLAQKAAKRRKLNEEVEDLKRHLEIVPDEDDDVYTEATPLATKKNFDREDLKALWSLVKERFSTSKPKNFSDYFLLTTLGAMFKKPDEQAQLILLVERRYPLSRFTLDQMLDAVRLRVEEESEISLELLRFTRQQHQEGQLE
nr:hypothetical protein [Tanacetum cinerariifolium]